MIISETDQWIIYGDITAEERKVIEENIRRENSIWLPNYNAELIQRLHRVLFVRNGQLWIDGTRVRTPTEGSSHPCYNCGQCIDNMFSRCQRSSCERELKKINVCLGRNSFERTYSWIHQPIDFEFQKQVGFWMTRKKNGVIYNYSRCKFCHKEFKWIGDYEQAQHVVEYKKICFRKQKQYVRSPKDLIESIEQSYFIEEHILGRTNISGKYRHFMLSSFNYRCADCGATNQETRLHIDHIVPISKGGSNKKENLQVLCKDCNLAKHTDVWEAGK